MGKGIFTTLQERLAGLTAGSRSRLCRLIGAARQGCAQVRPAMLFVCSLAACLRIPLATLAAMVLLLVGADPALAAPIQGGPMINTAWLFAGATPLSQSAVTVTYVERTESVLTFYVHRPGSPLAEEILIQPTEYQPDGAAEGSFLPLPPPIHNGTILPVGALLPLVGAKPTLLKAGEPLFITLADGDQNLDPTRAETVLVTISSSSDTKILRLTETGPDTGIFSGYLMTSATPDGNGSGALQVTANGEISGHYVDSADGSDTAADAALVDPLGTVFDSRSGEPISAVLVRLVDAATGSLARVYGDGGLACPIDQAAQPFYTGGSVTDGCGVSYDFNSGGYRFPLVEPGEYHLLVTPPDGYAAPSAASDADLRGRDWWDTSYSYLLTVGSRGERFMVDPGPALLIDIPVDPLDNQLWLRKQVNYRRASVGDFLQYRLTLENGNSSATMPQVVISDQLPLGFRYQKNSTRLNGTKTADPQIGADGRQLTFAIGDITPAEEIEISYVVEVAAGARNGEAINRAQASDNRGTLSNTATATVLVREEFFRNSTFLFGRVAVGDCGIPDTDKPGLGGVRIYLEDGTYVVTDQDGRYHFEGIAPGTHVVQVDTFDLPAGYELLPCDQSTQFAGRSFSQFVDLQGGTLWQVNFHAAPQPPPSGEMNLALQAALDDQTVRFTATASAHQVPAENLQLTVMLPAGFAYLPGSAQRDGTTVADPQTTQAGVIFQLPSLPAGQTVVYTFSARLDGSAASGELPAKAVLLFDTAGTRGQHTPPAETRFALSAGQAADSEEIKLYPRFPSFIAELQETDRLMLEQLVNSLHGREIVHLDLVGHTDSQGIAARSQHLFADNQALSEARALQVANYLRERLDLADVHWSIRGMGDSLPVADNATESGRALNRRVELYLVTRGPDSPARLTLPVPASPVQTVPVVGLSVAEETRRRQQDQKETVSAGQQERVKGLLSPLDGRAVNHIEAVRARLDTALKPRLTLDGREIPADRIGFRMTEPETKTTLYTYIGVDFGEPGTRTLLLEGLDPFGNVRFTQTAELVRTGDIAGIRLVEAADNLADGRTPVRIRVELIDVSGLPVQAATSLGLANSELRPLGEQVLALDADLATLPQGRLVVVDPQGWISFNPVDRSGRYPLRLTAGGAALETELFVKPQMRDWILVGFAQGTVGYNTLKDNKISAAAADIDEDGYSDGQVKLFAKGSIKGEWLLTLAYDSAKPDLDGDSLQQIIDPDTYYPLYGDETRQGNEAASAENLYVKLERNQFQAMFGDMQTGLTETVLSQYSRSMNGFKSEMQSERFSYTVFAAETSQAFVKDELRGDGTSGRYTLSAKKLVINSEEVVIETRDRFHNERIIKEERLSRHLDYDIDFETGTLWFKRPVPSKDQDFNPVFIVVRYETRASDRKNWNYGGRAAAWLPGDKVEVGATLVREENGAAEGDLYGADVTVQLTPRTNLRGEIARTEVKEFDDKREGDAYLAELAYRGEHLDGRSWLRQQGTQFGLGQQSGGTDGMRTYGAEGAYRFNPRWNLAAEAWHEDNLRTDASRDVASLQGFYRTERYGFMTGLREARDRLADGDRQSSRQLLLGSDWSTPGRKLTLRAGHEQSLGGSDRNSDFPTRTLFGADYLLARNVSLFAEQEFTWGDQFDTQGTRVGIKATPWQGGELRTAMERRLAENGERMFALFGLGQSWQLNQRWSVDLAVDRSQSISNKPATQRLNEAAPPTSGGDVDFTAVSVGAAYKADKWSWWNRLETRQSGSEDKVGISSGLVGEVREGTAVSARLMSFIVDFASGGKRNEQEITLGLAYRPSYSRWILLERLDLFLYDLDDGASQSDGMRIVNHLHASFRANRQWQTSFYYGLKYVRENFDGDTYDGYTDMLAVETRYNINSRWDIGLHGSALHSWNSGQIDYSLGGDIGYLVMTNAWVSVGYNLAGFEDSDFSAANYTAQGPFVRLRVKFDQQSVKEAVKWLDR